MPPPPGSPGRATTPSPEDMRTRAATAPVALVVALALGVAAAAGELSVVGNATQGGLLRGSAPGAIAVTVDGRDVPLAPGGAFLFGVGPDAVSAVLEISFADGSREVRELAIAQREWRVERIDGLPAAQVTPPPEVQARINAEAAAIAAVRRRDTREPWAFAGFRWPALGRISGVYGSRRVLNGEPRSPHWGLDIAAPAGTPVAAAAPGLVALAESDLYYTGGTVLLAHGYGITSAYLHLSAVTVAVGAFVAAGDMIGRVGATGRATGAHLDWRVNWFDVRLDPQLLVPPRP